MSDEQAKLHHISGSFIQNNRLFVQTSSTMGTGFEDIQTYKAYSLRDILNTEQPEPGRITLVDRHQRKLAMTGNDQEILDLLNGVTQAIENSAPAQ